MLMLTNYMLHLNIASLCMNVAIYFSKTGSELQQFDRDIFRHIADKYRYKTVNLKGNITAFLYQFKEKAQQDC